MKKCLSFKFAVLLLVCCVMFGCGKNKNVSSIYGTVTDFTTDDPVGNVNVRLNPRGETTLTGSDGAFQFYDIEDGNYSLSLSKNGYEDLDDDYIIEIENGNSVRRDLQLKPEVYGVISGGVVDFGTGEPIEGAVVTLSPSGMNILTDYDGHFEFLDLDARQYVVTVQKAGYYTNRKTVVTIPGGVVTVIIVLQNSN